MSKARASETRASHARASKERVSKVRVSKASKGEQEEGKGRGREMGEGGQTRAMEGRVRGRGSEVEQAE